MLQCATPEIAIGRIRNALCEGGEAFGLQAESLEAQYQNPETYRRLFAEMQGCPSYVTFYRGKTNQGKSGVSTGAGLRYIKADARDKGFLRELLQRHYDGIVDFMVYNTKSFTEYAPMLLENTEHYIYLSTYRVFADEEHPIWESSPRLLDAAKDPLLLASDDYCIYKAKGENYLRSSGYRNWTIIRPAITYSRKRCQLITYERRSLLQYLRAGKEIPLYEGELPVQGTMSWAGDVAEMQRRLLFNGKALCDDFNVTTSEHHTWGEIAEYYKDLFGLKYVPSDEMTYYLARGDFDPEKRQTPTWQLRYDCLFDRIMDNGNLCWRTECVKAL